MKHTEKRDRSVLSPSPSKSTSESADHLSVHHPLIYAATLSLRQTDKTTWAVRGTGHVDVIRFSSRISSFTSYSSFRDWCLAQNYLLYTAVTSVVSKMFGSLLNWSLACVSSVISLCLKWFKLNYWNIKKSALWKKEQVILTVCFRLPFMLSDYNHHFPLFDVCLMSLLTHNAVH